MFACLFETNVPNIPSLKPKLLLFWVVFFFCCVCFYFHNVCFRLYVSMLVLFLVIFLFCFFFVFLVLLSDYEKNTIFPASLVLFELGWLKGSLYILMFYVFVLGFLFIVLFVCSLNNEVALFCVCDVCFLFFVNKSKWFLVCIFWSSFFFGCFVSNFIFHSFQKKTKKPDTAKAPKNKNAEKRTSNSVSAAVFANSVSNFWGWATKMRFLLKAL